MSERKRREKTKETKKISENSNGRESYNIESETKDEERDKGCIATRENKVYFRQLIIFVIIQIILCNIKIF